MTAFPVRGVPEPYRANARLRGGNTIAAMTQEFEGRPAIVSGGDVPWGS